MGVPGNGREPATHSALDSTFLQVKEKEKEKEKRRVGHMILDKNSLF